MPFSSLNSKMANNSVSYLIFLLLVFILAISEIAIVKGKICEKPSKTWFGHCKNTEKCDQRCIEWEGAKHGACHQREAQYMCFCYFDCDPSKNPGPPKPPPGGAPPGGGEGGAPPPGGGEGGAPPPGGGEGGAPPPGGGEGGAPPPGGGEGGAPPPGGGEGSGGGGGEGGGGGGGGEGGGQPPA